LGIVPAWFAGLPLSRSEHGCACQRGTARHEDGPAAFRQRQAVRAGADFRANGIVALFGFLLDGQAGLRKLMEQEGGAQPSDSPCRVPESLPHLRIDGTPGFDFIGIKTGPALPHLPTKIFPQGT
jgi:hypothetical protein